MNIFEKKSEKIIKKFIESTMPKIKVESGLCRFNLKCHMNSVHDALNNNQNKIAMCFYIDSNQPIIHFLNIDSEGRYIDNTLGRWSEIYDYYLIKEIDSSDFFEINSIFSEYRKELKLKLPWYIRWFSDPKF
jgi:hypothetical protein